MVSVRDVAVLSGTSVGTVSNVLNHPERVSAKVRTKVQGAIDALGFVRNDAARQLREGRSRMIGLVVLDAGNPFFTDVARGVERVADEAGLSVSLGNSDSRPERELRFLDLFEQQQVRGLLLSPSRRDEQFTERIERIRQRGVPVVLVDSPSDNSAVSSVAVDDALGGQLAVAHLLALGHHRIAFIGGPQELTQVSDRLAGARRALAEALSADPASGIHLEVIPTSGLEVRAGRAAGEELLRRPAAERPRAIFAANDLVAIGLLQAFMLAQPRVRVPEDIALVGYDDIDFAKSAMVPLSSIHQPSELLGETAMRLLLRAEQEGGLPAEQIVLKPELIARASTLG
ncbi:LacI family DNA-binding transcriptional regulator [Psychromicrobium xiongbiense]|uniref:LacI family DNA-binding transcriptional regulator n=1 Tax=Psychromicrobium xiongbiense TaxID=3051184 RepID=UPI002553631D|nr:LacI family DNA-binding transcriptional regulator [Psychromicrobium sp. YIM S02556]